MNLVATKIGYACLPAVIPLNEAITASDYLMVYEGLGFYHQKCLSSPHCIKLIYFIKHSYHYLDRYQFMLWERQRLTAHRTAADRTFLHHHHIFTWSIVYLILGNTEFFTRVNHSEVFIKINATCRIRTCILGNTISCITNLNTQCQPRNSWTPSNSGSVPTGGAVCENRVPL